MQLIELFEGDVVPFRRPTADTKPMMRSFDAPIDFELRYVRDPEGNDWQFGFNHTEDYETALASMKYALAKNPKADQGIEGMQYVDFVPKTDTAKTWLTTHHMVEQPRLYGKIAIIDLLRQLRRDRLTTQKTMVW